MKFYSPRALGLPGTQSPRALGLPGHSVSPGTRSPGHSVSPGTQSPRALSLRALGLPGTRSPGHSVSGHSVSGHSVPGHSVATSMCYLLIFIKFCYVFQCYFILKERCFFCESSFFLFAAEDFWSHNFHFVCFWIPAIASRVY